MAFRCLAAMALASIASCAPSVEHGGAAGHAGGQRLCPDDDGPAWKTEIRSRLAREVSFEFDETPLVEAIGFIGRLCEVNLVIDEPVRDGDADTSLELEGAPAMRAVERILEANGLAYDLIDHVIFVGEPSRVAEMRRLSAARRRRASTTSVPQEVRTKLSRLTTTCFVDTPLHEVLTFYSKLSRVDMVLDEAAADLRDAPVNLDGGRKELTDVPLGAVLRWAVRAVGLEYEIRDGKVFVSTPERLGLAP